MCETYKRCCASGVESYIHAHRCLILVHGVYCTDGWVGGWAPSLVPVTGAVAALLWRWHCLALAVAVAVSLSLSLAGSRADNVTACRWCSLASLSLSLWLSLFLDAFHSSLAAGCHQLSPAVTSSHQLSPAVVAAVVAAVVSQPLSRHIDHVATVNSRFNRHDVNFP